VGHAIPGRLAGAGRCAAGARSSLLEDALAALASFAGLRHRPKLTAGPPWRLLHVAMPRLQQRNA
jgi:hypothetical protein